MLNFDEFLILFVKKIAMTKRLPKVSYVIILYSVNKIKIVRI